MRWLLAALLLAPSAGHGQARSLYWRSLEVSARLDADGRLHVSERQAMVFSGDWNGGERRFRVGFGQRLRFERLERVDLETGERHALVEGDLSRIDQYRFADPTTLRWRSRLPSDPPFDNREIVYLLQYTLSNILARRGEEYLLDHDFAFERPGPVAEFALDLALDPVWEPAVDFPGQIRRAGLAPGAGVPVRLPLRLKAGHEPEAVYAGAAPAMRYALAAALVAALALGGLAFYRRETALGRFGPTVPREQVDAAWLAENRFAMRPEVAGAAWDRAVGAPEVATVLARMVAERKLASEVRGSVLHLALRVPRKSFAGYEAALVADLFFDGDTTDTERVRKHYEKRGFDPAAKLRQPLEQQVAVLTGGARAPKVSRIPTAALLLAAVALIATAAASRIEDLVLAAAGVGLGTVCGVVAFTQAWVWRDRLEDMALHALRFLIPAALGSLVLLAHILVPWVATSTLALLGLTLFWLGLTNSVRNAARTREGPEALRLRKRLLSARRCFEAELARPAPRLKDEWFPYLVAFGLERKVERWFRAHRPEASGSVESPPIQTGGSTSGSASTPSWSGGGGLFGGGGASASWAAAAGALGAGVSAPSSGGSGSSGGGSGSSSSGGGSGGGW
ncbi:MAG: hypothetical protein DMG07_22540 [Acidobacteria bacterium]|nr:MAG: hypothetical protein DMG07_22540 [Acidobacteriota bacterium]